MIAWLIVLAGLGQLIAARDTHRAYGLIWRLIEGFAYVLFGVHLIAYPKLGLVPLTLGLALLLLFEGIYDILVFCRLLAIEGSSWVLVNGIVTLILGLMFLAVAPNS